MGRLFEGAAFKAAAEHIPGCNEAYGNAQIMERDLHESSMSIAA
jgi:hypothetical protein